MRCRGLVLAVWPLLALAWGGCSDGDSPTDNGDDNHFVQKVVGPEGGTLSITNEVTLIIPPQALSDSVAISIQRSAQQESLDPPYSLVSSVYSFEPTGTQFDKAAFVSFRYGQHRVGTADEGTIRLFTDEGSGWDGLSTQADTANNNAVSSINHLSEFAVGVDTTTPLSGIFAALVVGRTLQALTGDNLTRMDLLVARFDSAYAPCEAVIPLRAGAVTCAGRTLNWSNYLKQHSYHPPNPLTPFITLGGKYVFNVTAGTAVPALTDSIVFPAHEPCITSPELGEVMSLSGFTVFWSGIGSDSVRLVLMNTVGDSAVMVETDNDGSYTFGPSDLSALEEGDYGLLLIYENWHNIYAVGYDSRSFIRARTIYTTQFGLQ